MTQHRENFAKLCLLPDAEIPLDRAALLIAAEAEPSLDVEHYLAALDELAVRFQTVIDEAQAQTVSVSMVLNFIHNTEGFGGNGNNYYSAENSFLNQVLDTRCGIPISLALVHLALARRLGISVQGINFPGHFLLRYGDQPHVIVDPFSGKMLSSTDCENLLRQVAGKQALMSEKYLAATSHKSILLRLLDNLKKIYWQRKAWRESQACIERQLLLTPENPDFSIQLGAVYEMQGKIGLAELTYTEILRHHQDEKLRDLVSKRILSMQSGGHLQH